MAIPERLDFLEGEQLLPDSRTRRDKWGVNNSSLDSYFAVTLADHPEGVLGIIEEQLGMTEDNVGIDIAGGRSAVAMRQLLSMGLLDKGLVTNYRDLRSIPARLNPDLKHVKGDIQLPKTWQRIIQWQERFAPEGLALVMHRPVGGMQDLSADFYKGAVHLLLDVMRPGGVMFTQIPFSLRHRHSALLGLICASVTNRPDVGSMIYPKSIVHAKGPRQGEDCVVIVKS